MELHFITGSDHKFTEAKVVIPTLERVTIDLPEIQSLDPKEVIAAKLEAATAHRDGAFIVEDTSLFLDCLGGKMPGPLIKWFLQSLGPKGIYELAEKYDEYGATGMSVVGYSDGDTIEFFTGEIRGTLVPFTSGNPFGWDPIFRPEHADKTFGEMTVEEKNDDSHRKRSMLALAEFLHGRR